MTWKRYRPRNVTKISAVLPARLTFKYYHGLGVGDVNKDGRNDVIIPDGWWEAPKKSTSTKSSAATTPAWKFR